jgi:hypothetical protein
MSEAVMKRELTEKFCQFVNYPESEDACGEPARCKHEDVWLCAAHYDIVMDSPDDYDAITVDNTKSSFVFTLPEKEPNAKT